jgi:hypothetical protein
VSNHPKQPDHRSEAGKERSQAYNRRRNAEKEPVSGKRTCANRSKNKRKTEFAVKNKQ